MFCVCHIITSFLTIKIVTKAPVMGRFKHMWRLRPTQKLLYFKELFLPGPPLMRRWYDLSICSPWWNMLQKNMFVSISFILTFMKNNKHIPCHDRCNLEDLWITVSKSRFSVELCLSSSYCTSIHWVATMLTNKTTLLPSLSFRVPIFKFKFYKT